MITNVLLVVHILIAVALVGVVLIQRSEGGGLGMGGGGMDLAGLFGGPGAIAEGDDEDDDEIDDDDEADEAP